MRLWHYKLIKHLPRQQLLGQWRECIALIGNGWGKKHSTVDYVFKYPEMFLISYADQVYKEMIRRGYKPDIDRITAALMRRHGFCYSDANNYRIAGTVYYPLKYPEHNDQYLKQCIANLKSKGVDLNDT